MCIGTRAMLPTRTGELGANAVAGLVFDNPREALLNILPEGFIGDEPRSLWASGAPLRVPLCSRCTILNVAASSSGIAAQLSRDGRRVSFSPSGNLTDAMMLSV